MGNKIYKEIKTTPARIDMEIGRLSTPKKTGKKDINGNPKSPKEYSRGIAWSLKISLLNKRISCLTIVDD